jgi:AcrR family transcriptional regulator
VQVLKDEIRNKILQAEEALFFETGFRDTTMRNIADVAGISVSNLYLYYDNKHALYYGVTDSFHDYFIRGFQAFVDHDEESKEMIGDICDTWYKVIRADHKKFVITADKSQGTKYAGFKGQMIDILFRHMKSQVGRQYGCDELILYILAKNFIEGIVEIAKEYHGDDSWLANCLNSLVSYHMNGMAHLL